MKNITVLFALVLFCSAALLSQAQGDITLNPLADNDQLSIIGGCTSEQRGIGFCNWWDCSSGGSLRLFEADEENGVWHSYETIRWCSSDSDKCIFADGSQ